MNNPKSDGRLSKSEIECLLRALRANTKAAKSAILGLEPKLRAEFEQELNTYYPLQDDSVWCEAFNALVETYTQCQAKVDARCTELKIPKRFRPSIKSPAWIIGGYQMVKELRADMRRLAYVRIKIMIQERIEDLDRRAANVQLEILAHYCITSVAKEFFDSLPKVDDLITPLKAKDVFGMLEGAPRTDCFGSLPNRWEQTKLPEYQPDLGKEENETDK